MVRLHAARATAAALLAAAALFSSAAAAAGRPRRFAVAGDAFLLDGRPFQLISGAVHYWRVHPDQWGDRLARAKALGLNAVEVYAPWNVHEPYPGQFAWAGFADLERFVRLADGLGFLVLLRAGPYICAEHDFGGFPHWLASRAVAGGGAMRLRASDPAYLAHVDRWWAQLFARVRPLLASAGGPIAMMQVENEYGSCGADKAYLRHLVAAARAHLGADLLLYTTDTPRDAPAGTLDGGEVVTSTDFGPGWFHPDEDFAIAKALNAPGRSPPMDSEFYTGWLSHWGEPMANTSALQLAADTAELLAWNGTGASFNFYMVHGGTNFGLWAGANVDDGGKYLPHITSYDYDAPISEAGDYGQPGIGGDGEKFALLRAAIVNATGAAPPAPPPRPALRAYGAAEMRAAGPLLAAAPRRGGVRAAVPLAMEEFQQRGGAILYRTRVPAAALAAGAGPNGPSDGAALDLGAPVHDYAHILVDGALAGRLERDGPANLTLSARGAGTSNSSEEEAVLDVLVHAMGRQNFGCDAFGAWDTKGLQSPAVRLNGLLLTDWEVHSFEFNDPGAVATAAAAAAPAPRAAPAGRGWAAAARRLLALSAPPGGTLAFGANSADAALAFTSDTSTLYSAVDGSAGPVLYRGELAIAGGAAKRTTNAGGVAQLPDAYLDTRGWGKGLVFVNGFNLGWYWPTRGPQMTLYVPGPILRAGANELVVLEVEAPPAAGAAVLRFVDAPDFRGPGGAGGGGLTAAPAPRAAARRVRPLAL